MKILLRVTGSINDDVRIAQKADGFVCSDPSLRSLNRPAPAPVDPIERRRMECAEPSALDLAKFDPARADHITAPLRHRTFRRIWIASLVSNLGSLVQGVGVAWAMTEMSSSADKVALVQTALGLPVMLIAIPARAIADLHDRRIVALISLGIALSATTTLTVLASLGLLTPDLLLALCFAAGCGTAMLGPAWQAAVSEQVPAQALPAAVALNGISYNIARSVGPAIGGIIVATAGTVAAFALNAVSFLPLIAAIYGSAWPNGRACRQNGSAMPLF